MAVTASAIGNLHFSKGACDGECLVVFATVGKSATNSCLEMVK